MKKGERPIGKGFKKEGKRRKECVVVGGIDVSSNEVSMKIKPAPAQ